MPDDTAPPRFDPQRRGLVAPVSPVVAAIPAGSVQRLSRYLRHLETLERVGQPTVSSRTLGAACSLTDAQVRKDLARFGHFGSPGVGYRVTALSGGLRHALGTDRAWDVLLVGAGNLGRALASHPGFLDKGFRIVGVFDADPAKVGQTLAVGSDEMPILPIEVLSNYAIARAAKLAIVAVPPDAAQAAADLLVAGGVVAILNFSPAPLHVPPGVRVDDVDLAARLEQLIFKVQSSR